MKSLLLLLCGLLLTLTTRAQTPIVWTADSVRRLSEFPRTTDYSFPWLSPDGLRLYFVQDYRQVFVAHRPTTNSRFGPSQPVRGIPVGQPAPTLEWLFATYSTDELTVWYALGRAGTCNDHLFYRTRLSDTAAFTSERLVHLDHTGNPFVGCTRARINGVVISQDRQELYLSMADDGLPAAVVRFRATGVDSFAYTSYKLESGVYFSTSQLLDNDLTLLVAGGASNEPLRQFTRSAVADSFGIARSVTITVLNPHTGPFTTVNEMFYQPACRQLITTEATQMLRVMFLYTNVARAPVQQTPALLPEKNFQLSPNPAHHTVRLTGLPPTATTAQIIDAVGRTVRTVTFEPRSSNLELPLEGLPPGLYIVRVGTATRRLIVE